MASFSFSVRNWDEVGVRGSKKKDKRPNATVTQPSYSVKFISSLPVVINWELRTRIKIHCQPLRPARPSIPRMADASNPEKAPANEDAANRSVMRNWI